MCAKSTASKDVATGQSLYDQVQQLRRPGATGEAHFGAAGVALPSTPETNIALFQLTSAMQWPTGAANTPDVPYTLNARMLWRLGDETYGGTNYAYATTLYHSTAMRYQTSAVGVVPLAAGMRCYAWFNRQSGRWEILEGPFLWRRFEMTAGLQCGGSAAAKLFTYVNGNLVKDQAPAQTVTVYDTQKMFSKSPTATGDTGAFGIAMYFPDMGRWEILNMQVNGDFYGRLASVLEHWSPVAAVTVTDVFGGYNPFQTNYGNRGEARNVACHGNHIATGTNWHTGYVGDGVRCRWSIKGGYYWIEAVEPNDQGYQSVDVIVRSRLLIDFNAKSYTARNYTRTLRVPQWCPMGPETEHDGSW